MKTIEVNKDNAVKAFNEGDEATKKLLKTLFGAEHFNQKITDRVKTFEDACLAAKLQPGDNVNLILLYNGQNKDMISIQAYSKLIIIARALNEGWEPNWADSNEYKYYPWMKYQAGSGFSDSYCAYSHTCTSVGSRLCFKTRELAEYAATQFKDIYNDFLTL